MDFANAPVFFVVNFFFGVEKVGVNNIGPQEVKLYHIQAAG